MIFKKDGFSNFLERGIIFRAIFVKTGSKLGDTGDTYPGAPGVIYSDEVNRTFRNQTQSNPIVRYSTVSS